MWIHNYSFPFQLFIVLVLFFCPFIYVQPKNKVSFRSCFSFCPFLLHEICEIEKAPVCHALLQPRKPNEFSLSRFFALVWSMLRLHVGSIGWCTQFLCKSITGGRGLSVSGTNKVKMMFNYEKKKYWYYFLLFSDLNCTKSVMYKYFLWFCALCRNYNYGRLFFLCTFNYFLTVFYSN